MSYMQQQSAGIPNGRKLDAGETLGIVANSMMISVLITLCVFGLQCVFITVSVTASEDDSLIWLQIQEWYSRWLIRPVLFRDYIDLHEEWTLFFFGLVNQSGLFFYAIIRPICSLTETKYRLYGVPDNLRSRIGRRASLVILCLLFLNPGAWFDGIYLPNDLGLDWIVFGTSIWSLGGAWDVAADYRKFNERFPNVEPKIPRVIPSNGAPIPQPIPQRRVRQYQRSALPPPYR